MKVHENCRERLPNYEERKSTRKLPKEVSCNWQSFPEFFRSFWYRRHAHHCSLSSGSGVLEHDAGTSGRRPVIIHDGRGWRPRRQVRRRSFDRSLFGPVFALQAVEKDEASDHSDVDDHDDHYRGNDGAVWTTNVRAVPNF